MVNAGLHCSFRMSRHILPLLLIFGWKTFVLNATYTGQRIHIVLAHVNKDISTIVRQTDMNRASDILTDILHTLSSTQNHSYFTSNQLDQHS